MAEPLGPLTLQKLRLDAVRELREDPLACDNFRELFFMRGRNGTTGEAGGRRSMARWARGCGCTGQGWAMRAALQLWGEAELLLVPSHCRCVF